jgi:hypothetical protein
MNPRAEGPANLLGRPEGVPDRKIVRRWHRYPQMKNWVHGLAMLRLNLLRNVPFCGDRTRPILELFRNHRPDNVK